MIRLICYKDAEDYPGMIMHEFSFRARVFLDQRNSPFVTKAEKGSKIYEIISKWAFKDREKWDKRETYQACGGSIPYNKDKDYFVQDDFTLDSLEWRTHSDLIAYVEETDQKDFRIVDIPEGKKLTVVHVGAGLEIVVVSDGDCEVL